MAIDYFLISAARRLHRLKAGRSYVFGRDEKADIQIQDQLISRRHAELRWTAAGTWELRDLGSRNGVLVNGRRLNAPIALKDGAMLQVGGQRYRLQFVPPGADPNALMERAPQFAEEETMGPDFRVDDIVSKGANFIGTVEGMALFDLLQYFNVTAKTGRLDLTGGAHLAAVWFQAGALVHAMNGPTLGMDALIALARQAPKKFAFHATAPEPERRTLSGSMQAVLMEVARALDEERR